MLEGRRKKIIENMRVREASGCNRCTEKINGDVFVNTLVCQRPNVIEGRLSGTGILGLG